jgi:hypothetical protein
MLRPSYGVPSMSPKVWPVLKNLRKPSKFMTCVRLLVNEHKTWNKSINILICFQD